MLLQAPIIGVFHPTAITISSGDYGPNFTMQSEVQIILDHRDQIYIGEDQIDVYRFLQWFNVAKDVECEIIDTEMGREFHFQGNS